jgi:hypothetical protein
MRRLLMAGAIAIALASSCSESAPSSNDDTAGYTAPEGPGDPIYYSAIQYEYDQGDCGGLDSIIQGWHAPPVDPKADSYIAEAEKAKVALGCP